MVFQFSIKEPKKYGKEIILQTKNFDDIVDLAKTISTTFSKNYGSIEIFEIFPNNHLKLIGIVEGDIYICCSSVLKFENSLKEKWTEYIKCQRNSDKFSNRNI